MRLRAERKRKRRWGLKVATFDFDVQYADGTVRSDVDLNAALSGTRFPADYWVARRGAETVAGEGAPGPWGDYPSGRPAVG